MSDQPTDVLVVDDDDTVRSSWVAILRESGWNVEEAADAFIALEKLWEQPVGCILLDVRMPGLDGFSFLDRMDDPPPVIVVTAGEFGDQAIARRDRIYAYLPKPVPPSELIAAVGSALESRAPNSSSPPP